MPEAKRISYEEMKTLQEEEYEIALQCIEEFVSDIAARTEDSAPFSQVHESGVSVLAAFELHCKALAETDETRSLDAARRLFELHSDQLNVMRVRDELDQELADGRRPEDYIGLARNLRLIEFLGNELGAELFPVRDIVLTLQECAPDAKTKAEGLGVLLTAGALEGSLSENHLEKSIGRLSNALAESGTDRLEIVRAAAATMYAIGEYTRPIDSRSGSLKLGRAGMKKHIIKRLADVETDRNNRLQHEVEDLVDNGHSYTNAMTIVARKNKISVSTMKRRTKNPKARCAH